MATWKTAEQLSHRYLVGPDRLASYGFNGHLPVAWDADGTLLFDEDGVARIFRLRSLANVARPAQEGFGAIGEAALTYALPPSPTGQHERKAAVRKSHVPAAPTELRRTGTG